MSFKKLQNIFTESDKFNQIVEPSVTNVQDSIPNELSQMQESQLDTKFSEKRVEQVQAGFGAGVDFLPNDKASGFDVRIEPGQTSFNNVTQTPISNRGIGGSLGDGSFEPSVPLQTRFDLNFENLRNMSESNLGIDGILGSGIASNTLIGQPVEFQSLLNTFAESRFSQDIINQSQFGIEGSIFERPIFNFDFASGKSKLEAILNPPKKKLSKKELIKQQLKAKIGEELDKKKTEYLDDLKKNVMAKLEDPTTSLYKGISGVQTKVFSSVEKNIGAFGNSRIANFITKKTGDPNVLSEALGGAKDQLASVRASTDLVNLAKQKIPNIIDDAKKKVTDTQKNLSTEDPVAPGDPIPKLRFFAWDEFYNKDHTSKSPGYHYGPNVNHANLDLRYQGQGDILESSIISRTSDITGGKLKNLLGDKFHTKEPYIVYNIPTESGKAKSGVKKIIDELIRAAERYSPLKNAITDVERIGKYMSSASGLAFIAKQELLGALSKTVHVKTDENGERRLVRGRQRYNAFYGPIRGTLATVGSRLVQGGENVLYTRTPPAQAGEITYYAGGFPTTMANSKGGRGKGEPEIPIEQTMEQSFTGAKPLKVLTNTRALEIAAQEIVAKEIGYGKGGTLKAKSKGGDKHTLAPLGKGVDLAVAFRDIGTFIQANDYEKESSGMPFYFKDLRDDSYLIFRAYISGFTEEIAPTWNNTVYVGRSEPVYNYDSTERSLSFTLKLFAHTEDELSAIYIKMNRLTSMCYPEYMVDTELLGGGQEIFFKQRPKPPLLKLRVGELIGKRDNEVIGFIKSLSYSYPDNSPWETKPGKRVPKYVEVTIGYQVIHATVPNLQFALPGNPTGESFYGITTTNPTTTDNGVNNPGQGSDTNIPANTPSGVQFQNQTSNGGIEDLGPL
tara:strand:- start:5559 stop:8261 length:2703 start_codon:yes stop_codon:yes gene_type:complete